MQLILRLFVILTVLAAGSNAFAKDMSEKDKINALLTTMEHSDINFIRNGETMTAAQGAAHLRDKWYQEMNTVFTAEDFIKNVATKSRHSGQDYQIKLPDGKTVSCASWMGARLKEIEAKNPAKSKPAH